MTKLGALLAAAVAHALIALPAAAQDGINIPALMAEGEAAFSRNDFPVAIRFFRLAADEGDAEAAFNVGVMYSNGIGIAVNKTLAAEWYYLAALKGHPRGQLNLGLLYLDGEGVRQDFPEAARWTRLAADSGEAAAQANLGRMYAEGKGVPEDFIKAYKWTILSSAQGNAGAEANKAYLRSRMSTAQIAEAQRQASEWQPRKVSANSSSAPLSAEPEQSELTRSTGTAFVVAANGNAVTNAHVVEGCKQLTAMDGSTLRLVSLDTSSDLALLTGSFGAARKPLLLRQGRGLRLGDDIVVAGFPLTGILSSGLNVTTGTVSALAGPGDDRRTVQITAPVQPGNSGGPVLDRAGNVVGVVVAKLDAVAVASATGDIPQNVNFAISLGTLQAFLDANNIDYQTRNFSAEKSNADVAEIARAATFQIECTM